jgi:hypothetical protein
MARTDGTKIRRFAASWLFAGLVATALAGCGMGGGSSDGFFDGSVPYDHRAAIYDDLTLLAGSNFDATAGSLRSSAVGVIGTPDLSGPTLARWFFERVTYMLGESFDWEANSYVASTLRSTAHADDEPRTYATVTVMFNLGAHLFLKAVREGRFYGVQTGSGFIRVTTPRAGIVQIGEGMFTDNQVSGSRREAQVNRFLRLAVMFHEARHSDGNGAHAGFPHAKCLTGSYAGRFACEEFSNGPYAVQAYSAAVFASACTQCTNSEYQTLLAFIGDYASRLQPNARFADPSPIF